MSELVTDECLNIYKTYDNFQREVVAGVDKKNIFDDATINTFITTNHIPEIDQVNLVAICTNVRLQNAAYDQWHNEIVLLNETLEIKLRRGGSQSGGADCPKDFQKIFNYMFLIAASASIAVMSPDIELVTKVCMNALKLVFGTIVLPIINLLRVVFMFMLQSLVLIVKTVGSLAIKIISNFIKTVYLHIHTIASGAIGIAKVFIYRSLTYCKSFYNKVVSLMPKEKIAADTDDITPLPEVYNITPEVVDEINKSMNEAVKTEFLGNDMTIDINAEPDILMEMLNNFGEIYDAIRERIKFVYSFIQTAYLLVCDKAYTKLVAISGSPYSANRVKLLLTKAILNVEMFVIHTLNAPEIATYYMKDAFLRLLKSVHSETDPLFDQGDESTHDPNESKLVNVINAALKNINDAKTNTKENVKNADDAIMILFKPSEPSEPVANEGNKKRKLVENTEYAMIMERLNVQLEVQLEKIRNRNTPNVIISGDDHDDDEQRNKKTKRGGSKKRRTKKAKKLRNKRRYSRKH
jgi:hypothetical protein